MNIKSITIEGLHNVERKTYNFNNLAYLHGPNGAGKSTVLQAVQLALLGYIPGTNKTKDAIFKHAGNHTMAVTLVLDDNGRQVSVRRVWTGTKTAINSSVDIIPDMYDMSKIVAELELPIFNFNEFVNMTANKLKDWFIDFLPSVDVATDWEKVLKEDAAKAGVDNVDPDMLKTCISDIKSYGLKGSDEVRKANEYFKSALSFKKKELERSQSTIQSLIYYDDVTEEMTEAEIADKISKLDAQKRAQENAFSIDQRNHAIQQQIDALSGCTAATAEEDSRRIEAREAISSIDSQIESLNIRISEEEEKARANTDEAYELRNKKSQLAAEISVKQSIVDTKGVCPFTKVACDSVQPMIEQYKKEIESSQKDIADIDDHIQILQTTRADINSAIEEFRKQIRTLESERKDKFDIISRIDVDYARKASLESQITPVPEVAVSGMDFDGEIQKLRDIQVKYAANRRYNEMIDKLTAEKYVIEQEINLYKSWINLTGVNGLQNAAEAATPFLNLAAQMNKYIQAVFGETVTSKFNLEAKANSFSFGIERGGVYIPFNLLSSGEKCMYTLALMMSLVEVSESPLKLVMVDDLLDHLDDVNIAKLFESLSKEKSIQMIFAGVKSAAGDFVVEV